MICGWSFVTKRPGSRASAGPGLMSPLRQRKVSSCLRPLSSRTVRAHPSWDLHFLLHDARRDVSPGLEAAALERYFALRPEIDREAFLADYAGLAALNEARILGVFARLIARDAKPRYGQFVPRMWRHIERSLDAPGMEGLRTWFDRHVPHGARA